MSGGGTRATRLVQGRIGGGKAGGGSRYVECPVCGRQVALLLADDHVTACLSSPAKRQCLSPSSAAEPAVASPAAAAAPAAQPGALASAAVATSAAQAGASAPPPPPPPPPPPLPLRWKESAAPPRQFGVHTGKAALLPGGIFAGTDSARVQRTSGLDGHLVYEGFISEAEEEALLRHVDGADAPPWHDHAYNGRHRGKAWGVRMLLAQKAVRPALPAAPFPDWLEPIVRRICTRIPQLARYAPNEVNAISYERERGDCLSAHVDEEEEEDRA